MLKTEIHTFGNAQFQMNGECTNAIEIAKLERGEQCTFRNVPVHALFVTEITGNIYWKCSPTHCVPVTTHNGGNIVPVRNAMGNIKRIMFGNGTYVRIVHVRV
jgi:hypothetical protein